MTVETQVKTPLTERINRIEISATLAVVNEADRMRLAGADLVDFGAGEPHFATPQHIKDAAIAAIGLPALAIVLWPLVKAEVVV